MIAAAKGDVDRYRLPGQTIGAAVWACLVVLVE